MGINKAAHRFDELQLALCPDVPAAAVLSTLQGTFYTTWK